MTAYEALEKAIETNGLHMKLLKFKLVHAYKLQYANHDTQVLNQYFKNNKLFDKLASYENAKCISMKLHTNIILDILRKA